MKKFAILLFALVLIVSMMSGCRRNQNGEPGDPTVNSSSTTVPMTTSGTVPTTQGTRPTTEPTMHTTSPGTSSTTEEGTATGNTMPGGSGDNGGSNGGSNRNRVMPGR